MIFFTFGLAKMIEIGYCGYLNSKILIRLEFILV